MTPAKRRPAPPSSEKPARAAKKSGADRAPAEVVAEAAPDVTAPPAVVQQPEPEVRPAAPAPARSRALHPERIWPD